MIAKFVRTTFQKYPLASNSVTYTGLYLTAEVSQQIVTKKVLAEGPTQPLDISVLCRYAAFASCIGSPLLYFWYQWLDKKYVGTATRIIVRKVLLDQFLMTPILVASFFISMAAMENREDEGLFDELGEKFVPTFKNSCLFWIPIQTINFVWIPPAGRIVYIGCASFAWANVLCYIKRGGFSKHEETSVSDRRSIH